MEYTEVPRNLDAEIEIEKAKIRNIEGVNNYVELLEDEKGRLADLENSWFAGKIAVCTITIVHSITLLTVKLSLTTKC